MTEREMFDRRMTATLRRLSTRKELVRKWKLDRALWSRWGGKRQAAIVQAIIDTAYRSVMTGDRASLTIFWTLHQVARDPLYLRRIIGEPPPDLPRMVRSELRTEPPRTAEFLLRLLLPAHQRQHAIGDLVEEYRVHVLPKFGRARASLWFWYQAISSAAPALGAHFRTVLKLTALFKAADWIRRIGV